MLRMKSRSMMKAIIVTRKRSNFRFRNKSMIPRTDPTPSIATIESGGATGPMSGGDSVLNEPLRSMDSVETGLVAGYMRPLALVYSDFDPEL